MALLGREALQPRRQFGRAGPGGGLLVQTTQADALQVSPHLGAQLPQRHRLLAADLVEQIDHRRRLEGDLTGQQPVEDDAQRPHVRGGADVAQPLGLLGGHVRRRAHDGAGRRQPAPAPRRPRQPQVGELGPAPGAVQSRLVRRRRQQHVLRLEIPVNDSLGVKRLHRPGEQSHQPGCLRTVRRRAAQPLLQVAPLDVLQRQVGQWPAVRRLPLAHLVDLDDGRVVQSGDRLGLRLEPGQGVPPGPPG
jgi:hypothetical protein